MLIYSLYKSWAGHDVGKTSVCININCQAQVQVHSPYLPVPTNFQADEFVLVLTLKFTTSIHHLSHHSVFRLTKIIYLTYPVRPMSWRVLE